jgi:hypothetical protein
LILTWAQAPAAGQHVRGPLQPPINIFPVAHADDVNDQDLVGDHVDDAIVADADSVGVIGAGEFGATGRPGDAGRKSAPAGRLF